MSLPDPSSRSQNPRRSFALLTVAALVAAAGTAHARPNFLYSGEPVHPGCVHALVMQQGDSVPVTTAVSLEGCASSQRARAKIRYVSDDLATIEDDELLGGGSFGYRVLNQLDNGIFGLAILRTLPDGEERVSLAAVKMVERPMIRHGNIVRLQMIELLGELWIPDMEVMSFRSVGNRVHFTAGQGPERVERDVDFTRLGKLRK